MDSAVYIWKTEFGWAALVYGAEGAKSFNFGYPTRADTLSRAKALKNITLSDAMRDGIIAQVNSVAEGPEWLGGAVASINKFFTGRRVSFEIPVDLDGYTGFQRAVWSATGKIPFGETRSYGWIAGQAGSPGATRAAGSALGANPLPVIIPCHRVVRADGSIGGFGMGAPMKERLLKLEGCLSCRK